MTQPSTFRQILQTMYDGTVVDVSDYVISGGPQLDFDRLDNTTFRASGYRATKGSQAGAAKSEFKIKYRYDQTLFNYLWPLIGNDTGFLLQVLEGNGAYPQQGDDYFVGTYTLASLQFIANANSTNIEEMDVDYCPTDSTSATVPVWKKV